MRFGRSSIRARSAVGALITALALAAAGCGSGEPAAEADQPAGEETGGVVDISGSGPVGEETAGSVAALVTCDDWNAANEEQRLATIEDVRSQEFREERGGVTGPKLTDEEAAEVFDHGCEPSFAGGFRLYKLYAVAAGFVTLHRAVDE